MSSSLLPVLFTLVPGGIFRFTQSLFFPCDTFYSVICSVPSRSHFYTLFCLWQCVGSHRFPIYRVGFGAKFDQIEIQKGLWGKKPPNKRNKSSLLWVGHCRLKTRISRLFLTRSCYCAFSHLWVCIWLEIDKPESLTIQKALCVRVHVCEEGIRAAFLFILLAFSRWRSAERIHFLTCSLSLPHYWPAVGSCRKPGEFSGPDSDAERGRRCFSPRGVKAQDVWV